MDGILNFNGENVRVRKIDGELWWIVNDVCKVLDITNPYNVISRIDGDDLRTMEVIDRIGRSQNMNIVNESGLYQIIFMSRKEEAKKFKQWVTSEVLPSIRKTGKYSIGESITKVSKHNRRMITDSWKACGIENPKDYATLTVEEYKALRFEKGKRKKDMGKEEILLLAALESMEALNLHYNPVEGFFEARTSIHTTANKIQSITHQKGIPQ